MTGHGKIERRITLRLLSYWEKLRRERDMPHEDDINPDDIADLWDHCFLVHVQDLKQPDYNYTYLGDAILEAYRHGLSEDDPNGIISPHAQDLAQGYEKILNTRKPLLEEGEFLNPHRELVKYRQCLMPLGENGKIEAILGCMHFKIFP